MSRLLRFWEHPLRILLLNQFFWPDAAATSQLLTDLACHLAGQGHQVTAVCGNGTYAGAGAGPAPPITIRKVPGVPFTRTTAGRILSYAFYFAGAIWFGLRMQKPDLILSLTTPPGLSLAGALVGKLRRARHYLWEMDVYPDVAVDIGVLRRNGAATRLLGRVLDAARRSADGIIAIGDCMAERLEKRGLPAGRIHVAENWADGREIQPLPFLAGGKFTVMYSGNLGLAHDLDSVQGAMLELKNDENIGFVFAGGGPRRPGMEEFCKRFGIANVEFRPYCKRAELARSLAGGDVGLVTLKAECCGSLVPSKVYGIMAAGRPVLFLGPREATPARIIRRFACGWHIECGRVDDLVGLLRCLASHPEIVRAAGYRARQAFLEHYDLPTGVARICEVLGILEPTNVLAGPAGN